MKLNFKKISAVLGSVVMAGASLGFAAAASFPAPFVQNGVANVAVVYGTGAGVSQLDQVSAGNIESNLGTYVTGGSTNISGENVLLQMPSSYLHVGNGISQVFGRSVTKTDMPTLLADGTYQDSQNSDHSYTQKIDVANLTLKQFDLEQYDSNVTSTTPAIGFPLSSGANVLNYTLTFTSAVNSSLMQYTNLNLMGSSYYVLSASSTSLTLLDSAATATLSNVGSSTTLNVGGKTYAVSVAYIDSSNVKLTINGQTTDTLQKGSTYKLSDGSYVGIKDVLYNTAGSGNGEVDFSIGAGKIILNNGQNVQVGTNSVSGVTATIGASGKSISNISIQWDTGDTGAITQSMPLTMPAFDGVKLTFGGMTYPKNENTTVANDGNTAVKVSTTLEGGSVSLDVLGIDKTTGNFTTIGQDSNNLLVTNNSAYLNKIHQNSEFVISGINGKVAESHVYKVTSFSNTTENGLQVVLTDQANTANQVTLTNGQASSVGVSTGITLTPSINYAAKNVSFTASGTGANFASLYTNDGLKMLLPTSVHVNGNASKPTVQSYNLQFTEADKNGNIASGNKFNITVGSVGTTTKQTSVTGVSGAGSAVEVGQTNVYDYTVASPLATAISYNEGPTQETASLVYHGGESYGQLYLASPSATISGSSKLGNVLVTDSEISSVSGKNLVIVGGSCINSAAATALGVAYPTCGPAFTQATGVGSGQFLLEGVTGKFGGSFALVVAGYEAADTTNAATYLTHNTVDTSAKYVGTSGTQATLQVANSTA
jgi:hypothetical protein